MLLIVPFLHASLASGLLAALICWDASLAVKVLFTAFALFCGLVAKVLISILERAAELEMYLRLIFIATETRRLDARDHRRATDILKSDLEIEKRDKEIGDSLSAWARTRVDVMFWLVYGVTLVVVTTLAVEIWPR